MATKQTTPDAPAAAATAAAVTPSRAYLNATVTEDGEVVETPKFKYLPGHPVQIRADLKAGVFNIGGGDVIGKSLTFIPLGLRVFIDNILNQGRKTWAEVFFVDATTKRVCAVLFHGYSVENLKKLNASLWYDDLKLTEVLLTVTPEKKQTEKPDENGKMQKAQYFIAEFSYKTADPAEVQAHQEFAYDYPLYREETLTAGTEQRLITESYRLPEGYELPRQAQLSGGSID